MNIALTTAFSQSKARMYTGGALLAGLFNTTVSPANPIAQSLLNSH